MANHLVRGTKQALTKYGHQFKAEHAHKIMGALEANAHIYSHVDDRRKLGSEMFNGLINNIHPAHVDLHTDMQA
jgi:hypothetical protein